MKYARSIRDKNGRFGYDRDTVRRRWSGGFGLAAGAMTRDEEAADFTEAYIRRALEPRLRGHGRIAVRRSGPWGFTIIHRYTSEWNGRDVALPVAQLRAKGKNLLLYWKRANGRWTAYENGEAVPFTGTLDACLKEIENDRWGCFWG